jgi:hypothetical protein
VAIIANSTYDTIENAIASATNSLGLGVKFIWEYGNGVEPTTTYVMCNIISDNPVSKTESLYVDGTTLKQQINTVYETVVRFEFVGKKPTSTSSASAASLAKQFEALFKFSPTRYIFSDKGLSILKVGGLRQVPVMRDTSVFAVTGIDITFAYEHIDEMVIPIITSVDGEGTLQYSLAEVVGYGYGLSYGSSYGATSSSFSLKDITIPLTIGA